MFYSCRNNNKIKHLLERWLRLIYNGKLTSYEDLLTKDRSVSIHKKNIQDLACDRCGAIKKLKNITFSGSSA